MSTWDVVVVGAGPAGSSAALALARRGASVLLLERSAFPRWKVCGACLSPGALSSLESLGLGDVTGRSGAVPLEGLRLHVRGRVARIGIAGWRALSRSELDLALVREAERAGVVVWCSARARLGRRHLDRRIVQVSRGGVEREIAARVVIDATGLGRGLAEGGGATTTAAAGARIGVGAELDAPDYPIAPGELHMAVARRGYAGMVRVESGRLNVAAALDAASLRADAPERVVAGILAEAGLPPLPDTPAHAWRGTPALTRGGEDVGGHRSFRVGDAAGYVEPFTGEGIGWALGDGRAVAEAACLALGGSPADALTAWREHRSVRRSSAERLCRTLTSALRRPWVVTLGMAAVGAAPWLASPLVRRVARS